jgi:hypothetical protein
MCFQCSVIEFEATPKYKCVFLLLENRGSHLNMHNTRCLLTGNAEVMATKPDAESEVSSTITPSGRKLYYLSFLVLAASLRNRRASVISAYLFL